MIEKLESQISGGVCSPPSVWDIMAKINDIVDFLNEKFSCEKEQEGMTPEKLKEICIKKGITFIPHHSCGACGQEVGWRVIHCEYNVAVVFDPSCGCGYSNLRPDTWDSIIEWICDENGNLKEQYKYLDE